MLRFCLFLGSSLLSNIQINLFIPNPSHSATESQGRTFCFFAQSPSALVGVGGQKYFHPGPNSSSSALHTEVHILTPITIYSVYATNFHHCPFVPPVINIKQRHKLTGTRLHACFSRNRSQTFPAPHSNLNLIKSQTLQTLFRNSEPLVSFLVTKNNFSSEKGSSK